MGGPDQSAVSTQVPTQSVRPTAFCRPGVLEAATRGGRCSDVTMAVTVQKMPLTLLLRGSTSRARAGHVWGDALLLKRSIRTWEFASPGVVALA